MGKIYIYIYLYIYIVGETDRMRIARGGTNGGGNWLAGGVGLDADDDAIAH